MEPYRTLPAERLFTWVDVDERLSQLATDAPMPVWLLEASAWWDGLELTVSEQPSQSVLRQWLEASFGRGAVVGEGVDLLLLLDGPEGPDQVGLPVVCTVTERPVEDRQLPKLVNRRITSALSRPLVRPEADCFSGGVEMLAFHSFKGGVGRTVHGVALADRMAQQGRKVLLVDADLEAPGITWMYRADGGRCDVSFEDYLALLHGSIAGDPSDAVAAAFPYLANQSPVRYPGEGRIAFLPATRRSRLGPPRVEPADLLTHDRSPYFLSESLAEIALAAGLDTVVVDLRAGASELSAPLLLDPRVQRVFVTTLSSQSLDGTEQLIRQLGRRAPSRLGVDPVPIAVVTQYRLDVHLPAAEQAKARLAEALAAAVVLSPDAAEDQADALELDAGVATELLLSPFREELLALPRNWEAVLGVVRRCGLDDLMAPLAPERAPAESVVDAVPEAPLAERRERLVAHARAMVFAEQSGLDPAMGFLSTEPLRRLVGDHRTQPPIVVVVGAKGSGKTFTYAKLCAAGTWSRFAAQAGDAVSWDGPVIPVLDPANLDDAASAAGGSTPQQLRDRLAPGGDGVSAREIRLMLRTALAAESGHTVEYWRQVWLGVLARAAGASAVEVETDPEAWFMDARQHRSGVFVVDGLEDWLELLDSEPKRVALHALLTEVPDWLRSVRRRPLGLVVLVRQDLVNLAVRQNLGQFLNRYAAYSLRWDAQEALRLALWVATTAGAVPEPDLPLVDLGQEEISTGLQEVWGAKLGTEDSREAWTERWVPAALADFNGQVQARDVVRFLHEAGHLSSGDDRWPDRLLAPAAMRRALVSCSRDKVREISQESPELDRIFDRMRSFATDVVMPFEADEIGIEPADLQLLEDAGALSKDLDGRYRLPEIYRHALGFRTRGRARVVRG